jgi:hypothetical protein
MYLVNPYIYKKNVDDLSDSDSSDSEDTILNNLTVNVNDILNHNTLEEYNNYLRLWEYDIILHLFNLFSLIFIRKFITSRYFVTLFCMTNVEI